MFIVASATMFFGCKKSDSGSAELTVNAANIAGTYKVTAETTQVGTAAAVNTYATNYSACEQDDTHVFTASGTYTFTDAGVKCNPTTPSSTATFTVSGNQITIFGQVATVESLTATNMRVTDTYTSAGTTTKTTTTFTRQ